VNDLICRAFISSGTLATREPQCLCTSTGRRPDGVTQVPWKRGRCLAWDRNLPGHSRTSNQAARSQVQLQRTRRSNMPTSYPANALLTKPRTRVPRCTSISASPLRCSAAMSTASWEHSSRQTDMTVHTIIYLLKQFDFLIF
jgi:hypothetical protein